MGDIRFINSKANPRNFPPQSDPVFANNGRSMPNELSQKAQTSIIERYRAMLKDPDEDDDVVSPPSYAEIVRIYEDLLMDLTMNSKPLITDLTIIAGEQREHGEGIAEAICARIIEVTVEHKLPSLYLLDSIVKNIGREYVRHFSSRLPEVFCEAYKQVNPSQHSAMRHLFGTWATYFPLEVLQKIETQLNFLPAVNNRASSLTPLRTSESPRTTHGIHVNPKYLEARHHDTLTADNNIQHPRGASSNIKLFGHTDRHEEYDSDHAEITSSKFGQRSGLTNSTRQTSLSLGASKLLPSSTGRLATQPSPSRNGLELSRIPPGDEHASDDSSRWFIERDSPFHPGFDYQKFETAAADNHRNRIGREGPKALIDAYGSDERADNKKPWTDKSLKIKRLDVNGVDSRMVTKSWQNTEEEEYEWEDMSPTLADHGRTNDFLSSSLGNTTFQSQAPFEADRTRSTWASRGQPHLLDSSTIAENTAPPLRSYHGSQIVRTSTLGSHHPQETWSAPHHLSLSSGTLPHAKGMGRHIQVPFAAGVTSSSEGNKMMSVRSIPPDADAQLCRPPNPSIMESSGFHDMNMEARSDGGPISSEAWPPVNMHKSQPFPPISAPPQHKQIGSRFPSSSDIMNQGPNTSSLMPELQFEKLENKPPNSINLQQQLPNQRGRPDYINQQNQAHNSVFPPQYMVPASQSMTSLYPMPPPLNYENNPQGHGGPPNWPRPIYNIPNNTLHSQGRSLPPLPPGPPPIPSHINHLFQNAGPVVTNQPTGVAFSGLLNSLMTQGLISLTGQVPVQASVGLEFNVDSLKLRHESAITALYGNLPRQCTTCGLRFKCQEEHSSHMDWHVTKNRINKNRKQKPSRKWFVSDSMWLSGAEALGTDVIPGFLPTEVPVEEKDEEEMAVPADENQPVCALCGERFDDYFSDEVELWMYRGAVYLNAPNGSSSPRGPIVHAKCRPDSNVVQDEGGNNDEGSERKRMRIS